MSKTEQVISKVNKPIQVYPLNEEDGIPLETINSIRLRGLDKSGDESSSNILEDTTSSINTNSSDTINVDGEYPEGGKYGWLTVIGCMLACIPTMGLVNSIGVLQEYYSENQLSNISSTKVAWIFSIFIFLVTNFGAFIGVLTDSLGPIIPMILGACIYALGSYSLAGCKEYYQFMLSFGIALGISISFFEIAPVVAVGHWFKDKRTFATGLGLTGGGIGGVVYPVLFKQLFNKYGYEITIYIFASLSVGLLILSACLCRSRLPRQRISNPFDIKMFKSSTFCYLSIAMFFTIGHLFTTLTYLSSFSKYVTKFSSEMSFYIMAILNASSIIGRWVPAKLAVNFGAFNVIIGLLFLSSIDIFLLLLIGGKNKAVVIVFACIYGFASGGIVTIYPVCCSKTGPLKEYGKRFGTAYFISSFAPLIGIPIGGAIITDNFVYQYNNLMIFCGAMGIAATIFWTLSRTSVVGISLRARY